MQSLTTQKFKIPEEELEVTYTTGGGPGGQARNKTATRARVRWKFSKSSVLTDAQISKIILKSLGKAYFFEKEDGYEVGIYNDESRSRETNRENAIKQLESIIEKLLKPVKKRIKTKVSKGMKAVRRKEKTHRSSIKKGRGTYRGDLD